MDAVDEQKPSLFELLSEQQLNGLLPPTLRYLLTVATQRHPRYLLRVLNSFDELYALAMLVVEHYYLRTRGGTFTEHFYGLKRERVPVGTGTAGAALGGGGGGELLRTAAGAPQALREALRLGSRSSDLAGNLAVVVLLPYLKRRLDAAYEVDAPRAAHLGAAFHRLPAQPTLRDRLRHAARWFLRRVYPSLHAACGFAVLAFQLAYLFDGAGRHALSSRYAHPLLWLVSTRVRRMTAADYRALDDAAAVSEKAAAAGSGRQSIAARALSSLSLALPASIFALKFLEWWHASDFAKQLSRRAAAHLVLPTPAAAGLAVATGKGSGAGGPLSTAEPAPAARKGILKKAAGEAGGEAGGAEDEGGEENDAALGHAGAEADTATDEEATLARFAPIAKPSLRPVLTVPAPADSALCPICGGDIVTPTACQTGVVYCYGCIHKWVAGQHGRQDAFFDADAGRRSRWETGQGRCAVTGRRVLGGTEGLRRLMV